jgi:hypothetical protein
LQATAWFLQRPIRNSSGDILGHQPESDLCRPCGLGVEARYTSDNPEHQQQIKAQLIHRCDTERHFKAEFLYSTSFTDSTEGEKPRPWQESNVVCSTISGVRSSIPGKFVTDEVILSKLGCRAEELKDITWTPMRNENLEWEHGIVVPALHFDPSIPARDCEVYQDTQYMHTEYKSKHGQTIREGHTTDRMAYWVNKVAHTRSANLVSAAKANAKPMMWTDVVAACNKVKDEREAAIKAREAARAGAEVRPGGIVMDVVSSASQLAASSGFDCPPPALAAGPGKRTAVAGGALTIGGVASGRRNHSGQSLVSGAASSSGGTGPVSSSPFGGIGLSGGSVVGGGGLSAAALSAVGGYGAKRPSMDAASVAPSQSASVAAGPSMVIEHVGGGGGWRVQEADRASKGSACSSHCFNMSG